MKFYIPHAQNPEQEGRVYNAIKTFIAAQVGGEMSNQKVQTLFYTHEGKDYTAKVGEVEPRTGEEVIAILYQEAANLYHVCTKNRGVARGESLLVGGLEVRDVIHFD